MNEMGEAVVETLELSSPLGEANTDRPGSDYHNFWMSESDVPTQCHYACVNEERCQAWTFVKKGIQGPKPRCWLKDHVPSAISSPCCVSGVMPISKRALEYGTNRPGSDYTHFSTDENPLNCMEACGRDGSKCKAFTYVKSGVQGPDAKCWLKDAIPAPVEHSCCISGVFGN